MKVEVFHNSSPYFVLKLVQTFIDSLPANSVKSVTHAIDASGIHHYTVFYEQQGAETQAALKKIKNESKGTV